MRSSSSGLSRTSVMAVVVVLILVVLADLYVNPSILTGGARSSSSSLSQMSSLPGTGNQTFGLITLFGYFSQMTVHSTVSSPAEGFIPQTISYVVLGKATLDSAVYTKVDFSQPGTTDHVVAWFNSMGGIDRLDVIGGKNYTGPGAAYFAETYTTAFGVIPEMSDNATLFASLVKVSENTTNIGSTQLDVATYRLAAPTGVYKSITAEFATIPGTNQRMAVYLDEKAFDGSEIVFQVTSLAK